MSENVYKQKENLIYLIERLFNHLYKQKIREITTQEMTIKEKEKRINMLREEIIEKLDKNVDIQIFKLRRFALFSMVFFMICLVINFILFFVYYV